MMIVMCLVAAASGQTQIPLTWDFEQSFEDLSRVTHSHNDSAEGWMRDNYGDNVVQYRSDTHNPHAGKSALRMDCFWWNSGKAQILSSRFRITKGKQYVVRVWLRGKSMPSDRQVDLHVRNTAVQDVVPLAGQAPPNKWSAQAKRFCSVTEQWTQHALNLVPTNDADVEIALNFACIGTLWIDDVSITEGQVAGKWQAAVPSSEQPRKGNLLYNGSFEVGEAGWGPTQMHPQEKGYGDRHMDITSQKTEAAHGRYALRVDASEWFESQFIKVRPGQKLTLSAYMRTEGEPMGVQLALLDGSQVEYAKHPRLDASGVKLTRQWKRFSVTGRMPATANNGVAVRIWGGPGVFWVDGVQVEEGELTEFAPGGKAELGLSRIESKTGIYHPGDESKVRLHVLGPAHSTVRVESRLEDYYDVVRKTITSNITLDEHGNGSADLQFELPAPGIYRLLSSTNSAAQPGEIIMAQTNPASAPYGGLHASVMQGSIDVVRDSRVGWWRLHDHMNPVLWRNVEPEKGKFVFNDDAVDRRIAAGTKLLGCLYGPPKWAGNKSGPNSVKTYYSGTIDLDDYRNYVRAVVEHFKDRIHYWEIWNEPSGIDPDHYFKLLKIGYETIKQVDPQAFVVGGGGLQYYACEYLDRLFTLGGLKYMDAYSFHGYMVDGWDPWQYGRGIKDLMAKHGKVVAFWDTEWGMQCRTFRKTFYPGGQSTYRWPCYPYRTAVNMVARHEIAERAIGVEVNFWYTLGGMMHPLRNDSGGLMHLLEYDQSPRATLACLANTWDLLGQVELVKLRQASAIARLYTFKHPEGALLVVDTKLPQGVLAGLKVPINRKAEHINVMGERKPLTPTDGMLNLKLTDEPVFVLIRGADPQQVAQAADRAEFVAMMPETLKKLLTCDRRNRVPDVLRGATFEREVKLGFEIQGWLMNRNGEKMLVFAGMGPANKLQQIDVSNDKVRIFNSLSDEVQIVDGKVAILCGAPYMAMGPDVQKAIREDDGGTVLDAATNLLKNGSFEDGENGKTPIGWATWNRFSGKSTFARAQGGRTPDSCGMAVLLQSPNDQFVYSDQGITRRLKKGQRYGFSVWLRADRPVRADVYLCGTTRDTSGKLLGEYENRARVKLSSDWTRYSSTITIKDADGSPKDGIRALVQLFENPNTRVEIDDAMVVLLSEGK
jgi:hypothetical protein